MGPDRTGIAFVAPALLPAALLALTALWCGTLFAGATATAATTLGAVLLLAALVAAPAAADPLALGRRGRLLAAALLAGAAASWWVSPVARAGRVGLVLLPAFLLLPAAVARCWSRREARRAGLAAVAAVTGTVAAMALVEWWRVGSPRPALPLGHHSLLGGWLVLTLPLALLPLRHAGWSRWLALGAGALATATLVASGSLFAVGALALEALLAALWWPRARRWMAALAFVALALQAPRIGGLLAGGDLSAQARLTYLAAGWRGLVARPGLGWGPGATPWTAARSMEPRPRVNPPSEVVGDLHSLPIQTAYELGVGGALVAAALALLFARRRLGERAGAGDPDLLRAGLVALAGGGAFFVGNAAVRVAALPVAAAVAAGAALAGSGALRGAFDTPRWPRRAMVTAYLVAAAAVLTPLHRAHHHYDRARRAELPSEIRTELARAIVLDPRFPLYRARSAWLAAAQGEEPGGVVKKAWRAAHDGVGLAPLWLAAGSLAEQAGRPDPDALRRALGFDPLSPVAAFHWIAQQPPPPDAVDWGARALAAEPRLAAAVLWQRRPELLARILERIRAEGGDTRRLEVIAARAAAPGAGRTALALTMDGRSAVSFSIYAFRRSPWPAAVAPIELAFAPE